MNYLPNIIVFIITTICILLILMVMFPTTCCRVSMNCLLRRLLACNVAYAYLHMFTLIIVAMIMIIMMLITLAMILIIILIIILKLLILKNMVNHLLSIFASFCCLLKTETKCAGCLLLKLTPLISQ